jgi:allantoate deiminase
MRDCHREIGKWLQAAGADVWVDAAGNLRGVHPAAGGRVPRLLVGSHLDTVPNAGAFDGVLGVVLAVALLEELEGKKLPFALEVVGFSDEEGVRFGTPFIGSRALVGRLDDGLLSVRDAGGLSVREAIENFGLRTEEISRAALNQDTFAYLEFHIEQGPVLESLKQPLGVVEAIVGQTRMEFVFRGQANHAGTTPMHLRQDAMAAAAEWMVAVERTALDDAELVATVGRIEAKPGAMNVIAGEVQATVDLRHRSDEIRRRAVQAIAQSANVIAGRRGLTVDCRVLLDQSAVTMDTYLAGQIEEAIRSAGCQPHRMVSGAGHDAMILAQKVPAGMIFLRTPGGISHDPAEAVEVEDVAKAIECGVHLLDQLARSSRIQQRVSRA